MLILTLFLICFCSKIEDKNAKIISQADTLSKKGIVSEISDTIKTTIPEKILEILKSKYDGHPDRNISFSDTMIYYLKKSGITPKSHINIDINGDSLIDYFSFAMNVDSIFKLIAIFSKNNEYVDTTLMDSLRGDINELYMFLEVLGPGLIQGFPFEDLPLEETQAQLEYPGVHIVFYETSSDLFYWKNGSFKELWTSD